MTLQTSLCLWLGSYPYVLDSILYLPELRCFTPRMNVSLSFQHVLHITLQGGKVVVLAVVSVAGLRTLIPVPMYLMYSPFPYP